MRKGSRKQFCPRNHDTFICGRYSSGGCKDCRKFIDKKYYNTHKKKCIQKTKRWYKKNYIPHPIPRTQFCPKGHDKDILGREKNGGCCQCRKDRCRRNYIPKKRVKNPICVHGHNKDVTGRYSNGGCKMCTLVRKPHVKVDRRYRPLFCRKGHNKDIVGRDKNGSCLQCRKDSTNRHYQTHKMEEKRKAKIYRTLHKDELRIKQNIRLKEKRRTNIYFRLQTNIRCRIKRAIKENYKKGSALKELGCTIEFFKRYIEKKFYGKMTWKNYGSYWHLDHIKALWKFDLTNKKQFKKAANYRNMQPLTVPDHFIKTANERRERIKLLKKKNNV